MENNAADASQDMINTELKRGAFKLQNEEYEEAGKIFENLAITHDIPTAWVCLGGIKLHQLDSGKTKVQQAINCFNRAVELNPDSKGQYQETYSNVSLQQIEKFRNYYLETKQHEKKAKRGRFWNAALMGAAIGYGNQRTNSSNSVFRGTAGVAGAAYAIDRMNKNSMQKQEAKNLLPFYQEIIKQLVEGVRSYCSDNLTVYQEFLNKTNQLNLAAFI